MCTLVVIVLLDNAVIPIVPFSGYPGSQSLPSVCVPLLFMDGTEEV
jgi:hypothetical protein